MKMLIIKHIKTGKCREIKMREIIKYESLEIKLGDHINGDEIVIKIFDKEVKKMKYLEVKVVKVKKCKHETKNMAGNHKFYCGQCGTEIKNVKQKGNWVNGENLDKIKFPCFCSYIVVVTGEKRYGKLDKDWDDIVYKDRYQITKITNQSKDISVLYENYSLKKLMMNLNIHILKGKIILFEEE